MGEGITTRVQKELAALQTTTENITIEMRSNHEKLRLDTQQYTDGKFLEAQAYADARHEEVTAKINQILYLLNGKQHEDSSQHASNDNTETIVQTRFPTKLSKMECPRFNGTDFKGWWLKMEQFFCADQTPERDKARLVIMHLKGRALQWHQRFMKNKGSINEVPWVIYFADMRSRFCDTEFKDPMFELVSLKQTGSVEDYYDEFEFLVNLLDLSDEYALSIFLSNLKPEIARPVRLFFPKTITHAYNLAKQMDIMIFNTPPRPNILPKPLTPTLQSL